MKINEKHFSLYVDNILTKTKSNNQKALLLLSARGFSLKNSNDALELAPSTSNTDRLSLNKFLNKNKLGKIENSAVYVNPNCDINILAKIFQEKITSNVSIAKAESVWTDFQADLGERRLSVYKLDGFIASYINALNSIGIEIRQATDGNSDNGNAITVQFASKYNLLWHKLINDVVLKNKFSSDLWQTNLQINEVKLLFSFSQLSKYRKLLQEANYISSNRIFLQNLKEAVVQNLKNLYSLEKIEQLNATKLYELMLINSQKFLATK